MKKLIMFFAAMAAVLSSCSKSELESVSENESKDIVLNISVSNPGADDTKALIKSAWAADDEISIWFDTNTGSAPDLVIKYDGSNWTQDGTATNVPTSSNGYVKALYNGTVKVASKDDYTYENNTLTFDIANWKFLTEVQVVVKGLTSADAAKYTLACDKFTPLAAGDGYTVGSDAITASAGTKSVAVTGISNTDGVAFVFATADYSSTAAAFEFTLTDNTSTPAVTKVYTATTDKIIGTSGAMTAIKALEIANDKFKAVATMGFVDLGLPSGLKWGVCNLGASNPWDYGKYFQWGDVAGHFCNGTTDGSTFEGDYNFQWSNTPFHTGTSLSTGFTKYNTSSSYGTVDNKTVLNPEDDAASNANPAWRMPTKDDFTELARQCFLEWTEGYGSTDVKGLIVWKAKNEDAGWFKPITDGKGRKIKDDGSGYNAEEDHTFSNAYAIGTDTHLFFPAAGNGEGSALTKAGTDGGYFSSSLATARPQRAFYMSFSSLNVSPQKNDGYRCYGFPVRPVSN